MSKSNRSSAETKKALKDALLRLEHGRGKIETGKVKINLSSVSREAGVHHSIVHREQFSEVANKIRAKEGKGTRKRVDAKNEALKKEKLNSRKLRGDIKELKEDMAKLVSINATLMAENARLKTIRDSENITEFRKMRFMN